MKFNFVKIVGCKRSGTNFISKLLDTNLSNVIPMQNHMGWKHGGIRNFSEVINNTHRRNKVKRLCKNYSNTAFKDLLEAIEQNNILVLIISKNPYAWIYSIVNAPWKKKSSSDLFRQLDKIKYFISRYETKYKNWLKQVEEHNYKFILVRYEDILQNNKKVLNKIGNFFSLNLDKVQNIEKYIGPGSKDQKRMKNFKNFYIDDKTYLNHIPADIVKLIDDTINWNFVKKNLGYNRSWGRK